MTPLCAVRRAWIAAAVAASASADASARCFTYCGEASRGGGLASFFYFLNAAKLIADDEGARFLVPEVVPLSGRHGHGKDKRFGDVLGAPEWACGRRRGQRWPSPGGRRAAAATPARDGFCAGEVKAWLAGAAPAPPVRVAGRATPAAGAGDGKCREVVELWDGCGSSTNFSATRDFFRGHYRRGAPAPFRGTAGETTVAIHYRLGDTDRAATRHAEKRTSAREAAQIAAILAEAAALGGRRFRVRVVSDSRGHAEVAQLVAALARFAAVEPVDAAAGEEATARADFDALATADLVVCGHSGFCRVAALLTDRAVLATSQATGHRLVPLAHLPNVASFDDASSARAVAARVHGLLGA